MNTHNLSLTSGRYQGIAHIIDLVKQKESTILRKSRALFTTVEHSSYISSDPIHRTIHPTHQAFDASNVSQHITGVVTMYMHLTMYVRVHIYICHMEKAKNARVHCHFISLTCNHLMRLVSSDSCARLDNRCLAMVCNETARVVLRLSRS